MTVTLKQITISNYREAIRLKVAPGQEGFVASNVYSLAESKFNPSFVCLGIYDDDTMVGFLMHGDDDKGQHWIIRLMVDAAQQGKGYGRAAMQLILDELRAQAKWPTVSISYEPNNSVARKLYASLGFVETGEVDGGELVARLVFQRAPKENRS